MSRVASRGAVSARSSVRVTGGDLLSAAANRISTSRNIEHWQPGLARWDAEVLLAHVLDVDVDSDGDLALNAVSASQRRRFESLVERRLTGEPVNYITGRFRFCGLDLLVRPGVFSPRSSSEFMVELAVSRLRRRRGRRVAVDLATGAGAVALAVASQTRGSEVWGADISPEAARLGRANARRLDLDNVRFVTGDMLAALPRALRGAVDVITIHPPYVARGEVRILPVEIRRFEPRHTLTDGSEDGLGLVRRLADDAGTWLRTGGFVLVEIAPYLARAGAAVLRRRGLREVRSHRDTLGVTRVVVGRL
ncbi:MAG TPA: peptide chain release factor N(5)-glutamine methyltransferase [Candidatus Dormibacteraeota bacterium]